jgi:N-acetyl-gamma-glutamyl-phosphate reductase
MLNVSIIGGSGYTGLELLRILLNHPFVTIKSVTSRQCAGKQLNEVFPSLPPLNLSFVDPSVDDISKDSELVFTCVPHKTAMDIVPKFLEKGIKVIDLSADFRLRDKNIYETWYGPHTAPYVLKDVVYGLTEIYRDSIKNASVIANPGCYPTSVLLPLIPLLQNNIISHENIIVDSKSGVSGAGRGLSLTSLYCEANESFMAYKVGEHRHTPEIEQELSVASKKDVIINFTPHLTPLNRGIFSTIYCNILQKDFDVASFVALYYKDSPFVRIRKGNILPNVSHVRGSNYCDIAFKIDKRNGKLIIMSCIDNLVKGASGQAVQNMNVMSGFDEATALNIIPQYP